MELPVNKIIQGDCRSILAEFPENSIDALVTDPPYGIEFMGKDWDTFGRTGIDKHLNYQKWTEEWASQAIRVLKPGGHSLVFGIPKDAS